MEKLIEKIEEILEVDNLDLSKKFVEFEEWDSLSSLSIIALLDSDYKLVFTNDQLIEFSNIEEFCKYVLNSGK
jgi:acyl carrier protein